jgi:hypothetical protein
MRSIMADYIERLLPKPGQPFFFRLGGTGKITWVRHELPNAHVISLLDECLSSRGEGLQEVLMDSHLKGLRA